MTPFETFNQAVAMLSAQDQCRILSEKGDGVILAYSLRGRTVQLYTQGEAKNLFSLAFDFLKDLAVEAVNKEIFSPEGVVGFMEYMTNLTTKLVMSEVTEQTPTEEKVELIDASELIKQLREEGGNNG